MKIDLEEEVRKQQERLKQQDDLGYLASEHTKKVKENQEAIAKRRGVILNGAVEIEMLLNQFLGAYFTSDFSKYADFLSKVLSNESFTFGRKGVCTKIFRRIRHPLFRAAT